MCTSLPASSLPPDRTLLRLIQRTQQLVIPSIARNLLFFRISSFRSRSYHPHPDSLAPLAALSPPALRGRTPRPTGTSLLVHPRNTPAPLWRSSRQPSRIAAQISVSFRTSNLLSRESPGSGHRTPAQLRCRSSEFANLA